MTTFNFNLTGFPFSKAFSDLTKSIFDAIEVMDEEHPEDGCAICSNNQCAESAVTEDLEDFEDFEDLENLGVLSKVAHLLAAQVVFQTSQVQVAENPFFLYEVVRDCAEFILPLILKVDE